jgi:hypothetical protein
MPPSSNKTPTKNSGSSYTTSTVHQNPFGGVNQWGMFATTLAFTPSLYILLQAITSTPIHTMEVSSSFQSIKKFNGTPSTIYFKEFKAIF